MKNTITKKIQNERLQSLRDRWERSPGRLTIEHTHIFDGKIFAVLRASHSETSVHINAYSIVDVLLEKDDSRQLHYEKFLYHRGNLDPSKYLKYIESVEKLSEGKFIITVVAEDGSHKEIIYQEN